MCTCRRQYPGAATGCLVCSLPQSYQPSPIRVPGQPAHRPFRGLLGVHSRYGLHTRTVTLFRDSFTEGFNRFVTSTVAPVASGWSSLPGGTLTHWKAPPFHGAPRKPPFNEKKPAKVANPRSIRDHAEQLAKLAGRLSSPKAVAANMPLGVPRSAVMSQNPRWYRRRVHQLIDGRHAARGFCWRPTEWLACGVASHSAEAALIPRLNTGRKGQ